MYFITGDRHNQFQTSGVGCGLKMSHIVMDLIDQWLASEVHSASELNGGKNCCELKFADSFVNSI
jgi:hypothetical protein